MAPVQKQDAERALRLLEAYQSKLASPEDAALRNAVDRVVRLFRSKLFYALIDIQEYYEEILRDVSKSPEQVAQEAIIIAKKWERHPRHSSGEDEPHLPVSKNH
eukprot:Seg4405.2 transcript_id=Seg4405.2/GoldUCD/mRNA.D3Y31 product="Disks large 1 tumor suppressor protein" protein_id=Seg4405.2/GoldUCD/D3Y31